MLTGKQPYDRNSTSDFDIQIKIVSEPLNLRLLPLQWRNFLAGYMHKDAAQRKPLTEFHNDDADYLLTDSVSDFTTDDRTMVNDRNNDQTIINGKRKEDKNDDGKYKDVDPPKQTVKPPSPAKRNNTAIFITHTF